MTFLNALLHSININDSDKRDCILSFFLQKLIFLIELTKDKTDSYQVQIAPSGYSGGQVYRQ